ncbi:hypothetical protein JCM6882_008587 [Rhodosporidiobolus microsporus]
MACFSDLPQELVDYIVELATPSFGTKGWNERYKTLKTLHLVNKTFLQPARRLLASEIAVDSSSALDALTALFGGSADGHATARYLRPKLLMIKRTWDPSAGWPSSASEDDSARVVFLVYKLQPLALAMEDFDIKRTDEISGVQCLLLSNSYFREPVELPFHALTRLGLYDVEVVDSARNFSAIAFPCLVTLAIIDSYTPSPPVRPGRPITNYDMLKSEWEIFDYPERVPSSLQVLRLKLDPFELDDSDDAESLVGLLSFFSFNPRLHELHLVSKSFGDEAVAVAMRGCEDWCGANGVKLFLERVDDLAEAFNPPFWRFLDGVNARLGLNV